MSNFNKWVQNLYEQLENDREKLRQNEPRTFSGVDFEGSKKGKTYSAIEQYEEYNREVQQGE